MRLDVDMLVYHVLDGEFTFYVGDPAGPVQRTVATAGDVVPLPGGTPHTVRNESSADAVAFVVHAPGAPMENFCRALTALAAEGDPSMAAVLTIAARHGIELLGPVPQVTPDGTGVPARLPDRAATAR